MTWLTNIFQRKDKSHDATLHLAQRILWELERQEKLNNERFEQIMSAISDFAAKVKAHQDAEDAAIAGLTDDIKTLNDKITELQNSAGGITPEDQALLDQIDTRGQAIADKLAALDALTPPPAPPANP